MTGVLPCPIRDGPLTFSNLFLLRISFCVVIFGRECCDRSGRFEMRRKKQYLTPKKER